MAEASLYGKITRAASKLGARLFRNHVGRSKHVDEDGKARWVTTGLCPGSSDVVGWTPVVVTPDMVGRSVAVFTAIEVKDKDVKPTDEQGKFLAAVRRAGGLCGIAHSVDEALLILRQQELI